MKIKYSANNEISIEGSKDEFSRLMDSITKLIYSDGDAISINVETNFNPEPYDNHGIGLTIKINKSNSIEITEKKLIISGEQNFLLSIASNLPFDVESIPYHVHYDAISFPQYLNENSPDIVFEATSEVV